MPKWILFAFSSSLIALNALAKPDGEALFDQHCVACHRSDGGGSLGLPLQPAQLKQVSNDYLYKTIRIGRPGRIMPAFETLSDAQVSAIIEYLRKRSNTRDVNYSSKPIKADVSKGKLLFEENCQQCHGASGEGLGKGTGETYSRPRKHKIAPAALSNPGFLESAPDEMIHAVISNGIPGTEMAPFKRVLKKHEIDQVVAYLRSMEQPDENKPEGAQELLPDPHVIVDSPNSFEDTVAALKETLIGHNYKVFPDRYLEHKLFAEDEVNKRQLTIRYCNFNNLNDVIRIEPRIGITLPCRITVVENEDGSVQLIGMNMALIARVFNNDQLQSFAVQLHEKQLEVMEEVTF